MWGTIARTQNLWPMPQVVLFVPAIKACLGCLHLMQAQAAVRGMNAGCLPRCGKFVPHCTLYPCLTPQYSPSEISMQHHTAVFDSTEPALPALSAQHLLLEAPPLCDQELLDCC